MVKFYKTFKSRCDSVAVFSTYNFQTENPQKLIKSMSKHDQEIFPFDVRKINYNQHMENYILGMRKYLLKKDPEDLMMARKRMEK